ncbi:MAG TPA: hypothetical protein VFW95_11695 [Candidatus Limnocylindria bacterium]|nr:hypothetical protein [Candidatus Limnocylindria bacterium]
MRKRIGRKAVLGVVLGGALTTLAGVGSVAAHEQRDVGDYTLEVGFLNEPVFSGEESGLELSVSREDQPVEGLEESLQAQVSFGEQTRDLEISPIFGEPGAYRSVFFPTAAGQYSFRVFGDIDGQAVDETFTSGPDTFGDVQDVSSGQFPVQYPATADVVRDAEAGANAATMATVALVVGGLGLVAGLVALGLAVARRRS